MELELNRCDYAIVGLTSYKCLVLLPPSAQKLTQKVVVADQDGVLSIFSIKKGETETVFKTSPGPKITRVALGGTVNTPQDKIFFSCDSEVKGFTKKGKQFLEFETNLTELVKTMCVIDNNLFVTGQHCLYHYLDLKDVNSFICNEVIIDLIVLSTKKNVLMPILACSDRVIRVLEESNVLYSVPIASTPTVLHKFYKSKNDEEQIIYGTEDGGVGLLLIGRDLKNFWLLEPNNQKGQVTCLDVYDLTNDGYFELIVGRDDGFVEVYKLSSDNEQPKLIFSYTCNETVTALVCGKLKNNEVPEIVVSTYSGWIFGLSTDSGSKDLTLSVDSNNLKVLPEVKLKINKLRAEIDELEEKINAERDKYQLAAENNENALSTLPSVAINDKWCLRREDASYTLSIEVQTSIDNVLVQSDVPLDLLDIEKNSAVVSFSDCSPSDGNFLLATYRCQVNTTRLDLKIRTIEGQYGTLLTYVTPNVQPKCCQLRSYKIKPLSLHSRIHAIDAKRPYNRLAFKGGFSFAEIHAWIEFCLPEVPYKTPPEDTVVLCFTSTFLGTMLQCTYSKGEAEFKSDNISTISILKDVISKVASRNDKKKRNLDITWEINEESIKHTLDLIRPKLEHQLSLVNKMKILESMSELDLNPIKSGEILLTDEFTEIINKEKEIINEYKMQPAYLDRLYGMVTDLFIDKNKFKGINVKNKIPTLLEILDNDNYSYEKLYDFFYQ
ncbi:conserved hypothetical protein [Pediculus humanus corporis]|uniref:Bardet-Biedl syndrome 7 protein n=1 Tax=Pediculus humanus subsp. corporis TaxID=121224 RepID=E0VDR8_PEDHC|nr:uncharacterized protein Phum_PHUM123960 [Pediculus humanus corporis]EEB11524.1 conserved hypothetical protein [Pediculus humanus corporis]